MSLFSCNQLFPLFYICFITFLYKAEIQLFLYFFFLVVNLIVWFFVPSIGLCIGDKGGERAVIAVRVSSFQFFFPIRKKLMRG